MAKTGPKQRTTEKFIEDAKVVHGDMYDYSLSVYAGLESKITIICKSHGAFNQTAHQHLRGKGCRLCGNLLNGRNRSKGLKKFIEDAKRIHGDKYDYSLCEYVNGKTKMNITCKVHGVFQQHAEAHVHSGYGCLKCYHDSRKGKGGGGYALEYFDRHPEKREVPGTLYVARMQHKNDDFIKVGITATGGVKERFYYKAMHGTTITPLFEISLNLFDAFQREQELLALLTPYRYFPNRKFAGYTECFKNNDEVLSLVKQFLG